MRIRPWVWYLGFALGISVLPGGVARAFAQEAGAAAGSPGGSAGLWGAVVSLVGAVVSLAISLALSMWAVKKAIQVFDGLTKGLDEQEELKKGNVAVGILLAAVIYSIATVISGGVLGLTRAIKPEVSLAVVVGVAVGIVNLVVGIYVATFTISFALRMLDRITKGIDEFAEVGKGNVAVAVVMAGVLLAVSSIVQVGVAGIGEILNAEKIARALGLS
jgi:uncharacterized membrane protein YjfL (UPF0719 family)